MEQHVMEVSGPGMFTNFRTGMVGCWRRCTPSNPARMELTRKQASFSGPTALFMAPPGTVAGTGAPLAAEPSSTCVRQPPVQRRFLLPGMKLYFIGFRALPTGKTHPMALLCSTGAEPLTAQLHLAATSQDALAVVAARCIS